MDRDIRLLGLAALVAAIFSSTLATAQAPPSSKMPVADGVICPPDHVDPEIKQPTPPGGPMPVIPPPGSPGGDPSLRPK